ncbi:MAG: TetR/AcrR family transcriptional regulator [Candidatus Zixiibacteriota bacterium]
MKVVVPDRKAQIIQQATRLFADDGFDKVTIKELADACGITEPALYRHFSSKDAIYDAVLDSIERRLSSQHLFAQLSNENDLSTLLETTARHILDYFTQNQDVYRLMLFSALREHSKAKRVFQLIRGSYVRFLLAHLDRLYEQGKVVKKNNEITARCFIGMVFDCAMNITLWKGFQGKDFKPNEVIANNIPIYVRGLQNH